MLRKFENILKTKSLLSKGETIILGISGGVDSMSMLDLFVKIKDDWDLNVHVVHINHKLRGKFADNDANIVKIYCEKNEIPFILEEINVLSEAKKHKKSFEEMAREIRYQIFSKYKNSLKADKIAVAHNQNDQAETLLMRFIRGTGIDGLGGMDYIREDGLIRPLMVFSREEIENYAKEHRIDVAIDETNTDIKYTRNRIRNKLIPNIQSDFNSNIIKGLSVNADFYRMDSDFINAEFKKIWNNAPIVKRDDKFRTLSDTNGKTDSHEHVIDENPNDIKYFIPLEYFNALHDSMQTRFIRHILEVEGNGLKNIGSSIIIELKGIINKKSHGAIKLISGIQFEISYDDLCWFKYIDDSQNSSDVNSHCTSKNSINKTDKNEILSANEIDILTSKISIERINKSEFSAWLNKNRDNKHKECVDFDKLSGDLHVRYRKAGDVFSPLGMKGEKKLKDFFIDEKIPRDLRNQIPIVCDDKGIIWVIGYRISERIRKTESTKNLAVISWG